MDIRSPPVKVYSESHHRQRRLQPVRRTKTQGRPAWDDSPWMLWKISVMRMYQKDEVRRMNQKNEVERSQRMYSGSIPFILHPSDFILLPRRCFTLRTHVTKIAVSSFVSRISGSMR